IDRLFGESPEVAVAVAEFVETFFEALFHLVPAMIGADGDERTPAGDGAACAIADFDATLPHQIPRGGGDDRIFANEESGAGLDVAQIRLGDHVLRRLVYDRRPRIFSPGARRILTADLLSQGLANHRANLLSVQGLIRRVHGRTAHNLPPPAASTHSCSPLTTN